MPANTHSTIGRSGLTVSMILSKLTEKQAIVGKAFFNGI
jgi:hypothetical protein